MTTRDDVLDAIGRIERAGQAGAATRTAQLELLMLPPSDYAAILARLRAAFPQQFPMPRQPPSAPERPPPTVPPDQLGTAIQAMKDAENALSQQRSAAAEFDRQLIEALLHAGNTSAHGRPLLDDLETQIDCAARAWDLSTAADARELQRFLIAKLAQVIAVVEDCRDDDAAKQALAAAWAALYAGQADREQQPTAAGPGESVRDAARQSEQYPWAATELEAAPLPMIDPDPGQDISPPLAPAALPSTLPSTVPPMLPAGVGAMPTGPLGSLGGAPAGVPLTGLSGWPPDPTPTPDDGDELADRMLSADALADPPDAGTSDSDPVNAGNDPAAPVDTGAGPTTASLPTGETVTVATPQLAAIIQAAADGAPVAEAFQRQGVTIPPPGTAVASPLDQSRIVAGDIGIFTDRHALAVGNGKALLDGQIQHIANVTGPSFLGWQHPPTLGEPVDPAGTPTPTRPSTAVRV